MTNIWNFISFLGSPFIYLKGIASKFLWLGGGLTTISLGSAALRKLEVIIDKGQELGVYAFNSAAGLVSSIFTNTQRVFVDTISSIGNGGSSVWNYFFGGDDTIIQKQLPQIKAPATPAYGWWDTITAPKRWVSDSYNCYQDWAPVKFNLHLLQGKGGRLVGDNSEDYENKNMFSETLKLLSENIYKKDFVVENIIANNVDNNLYISKWIADGFQQGLDHINLLYAKQAALDAQIQSNFFIVLVLAFTLCLFSFLQGSAPLWRQLVLYNIELSVNSFQERKRLRLIAYEEKLNKTNPNWSRSAMLMRYPIVKPFQFKHKEENEYEKPFGLTKFWGNAASAINVFRMWRRGYLKVLFTWVSARLLGLIHTYMSITHAILQKKVLLLIEVLQSLNVQITTKHDSASLVYLLEMLLNKSQKISFLDFYVHNAPHHKILFGFLLLWGGFVFNKACAEFLVVTGNSFRDYVFYKFFKIPTLPPEMVAGAASASAASAAGGISGANASAPGVERPHPGNNQGQGEELLTQMFEGQATLRNTQSSLEIPFIPSPGSSPSQTLLNTRPEHFTEPVQHSWNGIRTGVHDVIHYVSRLADPSVLISPESRAFSARQVVENGLRIVDSIDLMNNISP